jgi:hypothetical protein
VQAVNCNFFSSNDLNILKKFILTAQHFTPFHIILLKKLIIALLIAVLPIGLTFTYAEGDINKTNSAEAVALVASVYNSILGGSKPNYEVFELAYIGYSQLKANGVIKDENFLTVIDFSLSANEKRMWVINMTTRTVISHNLVAHGKNSGEEYANNFSNRLGSNQSSIGFYITSETYIGKHGKSLRLDGVEPGINDRARDRAIVMHGADYVSEKYIEQNGRLGRSLGCPAIPRNITSELVDKLKDNACLFIYYPDQNYINKSMVLNSKA